MFPTPRRTKIICTLGPASESEATLLELVRGGMDVARFNMSHGTHERHRAVYQRLREVSERAGKPVAVLLDLQGPKIRLGKLDGKVALEAGAIVRLSSEASFVGDARRIPTTYPLLDRDVRVGETILLADGQLELEVLSVESPDVTCRVVVGGVVSSNKGLNMPGSELSIPSLVEKDLDDLRFGLELGVDYVALSFVRNAADVTGLRYRMERFGRVVPIVSKIEKPQAVTELEAIIDQSDGIMVARGDLGVELPPERVPSVQRRAIRLARSAGKISIVATQMLVSMTRSARPTQAEVSDVANAVFDGADAVMLSEETAAGEHPVRAVETMSAILASADGAPLEDAIPEFAPEITNSNPGAIAKAAAGMARDMRADAIVAFSHGGLGPRLIGHYRPPCPILGVAATPEHAQRMALYWGVMPLTIGSPSSIEDLLAKLERAVEDRDLLPRGSRVILTSKMPFRLHQYTNVLKLHRIGGDEPEPRHDSMTVARRLRDA